MPTIIITAKKPVLVPGRRLPAGIPVDVADALAAFLIERGDAQAVEVKDPVPIEQPSPSPRGRPRKEAK